MTDENHPGDKISRKYSFFRILLGLFLIFAGLGHLSALRQEFLAQVPAWLPIDGDLVVVLSGIVEIILGIGLIGQFQSGLPYTPAIQSEETTFENSGRKPFNHTVDLRIFKQFQFWKMKFFWALMRRLLLIVKWGIVRRSTPTQWS